MGSYLFKWPHPDARDVHVTGTFDDWGKTEKLNKVGDTWEKEVELPSADEKILYKFVVDDQWIIDHTAPQEDDGHYNVNNVLYPDQITRKETHASEESKSAVPGAFPETPANEPDSFGVAPIPASSGVGNPVHVAPGEKLPAQSEISPNTVDSTATTSREDYDKAGSSAMPDTFGIAPIPASSGIGNPIHTTPGEMLPPQSEISPNTVDSTATTSREDYDKAGSAAMPDTFGVAPIPASSGIGNPIHTTPGEMLPPQSEISPNTVDSTATTSKEDYDKAGSSAMPDTFGIAPIPASSGIGNPIHTTPGEMLPPQSEITPNTVGSTATTSNEDYDKAGSSAEPDSFSVKPIPASEGIGNPVNIPVGEKLPPQSEVSPNTIDSTVTTSKEDYDNAGSSSLPLFGGAAAALGAGGIAASAMSKSDKKENLIPESSLPMGSEAGNTLDAGPFVSSAGPSSTTSQLAAGVPLEKKRQAMVIDPEDVPASSVPELVKESMAEAHRSPEAATSTEAVQEKSEFEKELLSKVSTSQAEDAPASSVPEPVKESMAEAHRSPEAATSAEAVQEKSAFEKELLSKVSTSQAEGASAKAAVAQTSYYGLATSVPKTVEESMAKAHSSPEAAAQTSAVAEKSTMERELLAKVPSTDEQGEPAPTIAAATSATAPSAEATGASTGGLATGAVVGGAAATGATSYYDQSTAATGPNSTLGTSSAAAAAVSDGAGESEDGGLQTAKAVVPLEKSEGDSTEYAPPARSGKAPGVSNSAAAALSDGTEDPTLADEPAVKLMNQNDAVDPYISSVAPASTTAGLAAGVPVEGQSEPVISSVAPGSTTAGLAAGVPIEGQSKGSEPVISSVGPTSTTAGLAAGVPIEQTGQSSDKKSEPVAGKSDATKVPGSATAGPTSTSATSTPTKKKETTSAASSPSTSATKEKKKKHRISSLFKKIFD